jgi:hypothetical protein
MRPNECAKLIARLGTLPLPRWAWMLAAQIAARGDSPAVLVRRHGERYTRTPPQGNEVLGALNSILLTSVR